MLFEDLVLDVFKEDEGSEILYEAGLPLTPFIAYSAFKNNAFNKVKKSFRNITGAPGRKAKRIKAQAAEFKEKARASVGQTTGKGDDATVYRLTEEQIQVMSEIIKKHGKEIAKEILEFRRNILAPYQLIKRKVKEHGRVSSKDKTGMTRDQFRSALESGRKKIEARGGKYFERMEDLEGRIKKYNDQISTLEKAKESFNKGEGLPQSVMQRIFKEFSVSDKDLEGYSLEELKTRYDAIEKNYKGIIDNLERTKEGDIDPEKTLELGRDLQSLRKAPKKDIDLTKTERDEFFKRGNFDIALGKYFLRREIISNLKPDKSNVFRSTYSSIAEEMKKAINERKQDAMRKLISFKRSVDFTEKEALIWKKRPTVKSFSGDLKDYYQAVREEDFEGMPKYIKKSDALVEAEKKIENEIKKFERKLEKILSEEEVKKLKKYRLINNLISVRELKEPDKLFATRQEIESRADDKDDSSDTAKIKRYVSPDEFVRRLKEIATMEFDSMNELNIAKKEAKDLREKMIEQGDEKEVEKYKDIFEKINRRRSPREQQIKGRQFDRELIVDIDDIERLAKKIVDKEYINVDQAKQDKIRLDNMINRYKEDNDEAERNLKEIKFVLDKVEFKLTREVKWDS